MQGGESDNPGGVAIESRPWLPGGHARSPAGQWQRCAPAASHTPARPPPPAAAAKATPRLRPRWLPAASSAWHLQWGSSRLHTEKTLQEAYLRRVRCSRLSRGYWLRVSLPQALQMCPMLVCAGLQLIAQVPLLTQHKTSHSANKPNRLTRSHHFVHIVISYAHVLSGVIQVAAVVSGKSNAHVNSKQSRRIEIEACSAN